MKTEADPLGAGLQKMVDVRRRSFLGSIAACLTGLFFRRAAALIIAGGAGMSQAAKHSPPAPVQSSDAQLPLDGRTLDANPSKAGSYWFTDVAGGSQFTYQSRN